jgi:hypothetical protein
MNQNIWQHAILQDKKMKRKLILIYTFILLITLTACSLFQSEIDSVTDLLPRDSDVPGWIRDDSVIFYKGSDIKKYKREYHGQGIDRLSSCVYQSIDDPTIQIKLEIIKFSTVLNAYGFFSLKRGPGIFEVSEVNEYYSNAISVIQIGEYAVFAETDKTDLLLKKELKTFVNIPLLYIGQNHMEDKLPDALNVIKGFDGYGVLYSRKPYHKFRHVNRIYFTQWSWDNDTVDLFFNENDSFYDAYEIFKKSIDTNFIISSSDNTYSAFRKDQDGKYSFISVEDRFVFGCWSVSNPDEGKKILGELSSKISDYKKKGNK